MGVMSRGGWLGHESRQWGREFGGWPKRVVIEGGRVGLGVIDNCKLKL